MKIDKSVIQNIKSEIKLTDLAEHLGLKLRKSGANFVAFCPFHDEKTPSFTINPQKNLFNCFACSQGGDCITLYMKLQNKNFKEAVADLQKFLSK